MYVVLALLVPIIVVIGLWYFISWYVDWSIHKGEKPEKRQPEIKPAPVFKYGLHFNPVELLQDNLPEAPLGSLWEIQIVHENSEYGLSLGLYDLLTERVYADITYNLTSFMDGETRTSVADLYRVRKDQLKSIEDVNQELVNKIIQPMVAWSHDQMPKELTVNQAAELDYVLFAGKSENKVALQKKIV